VTDQAQTVAALARGLLLAATLACGPAGAADLADTIARVKPSIVAVGTFRPTDNPQFTLRGTGFAVGDGSLIATNAHVVGDQGDAGINAAPAQWAVQARLGGRTQVLNAQVVARDPAHDLAVLRLAEGRLPALKVRPSESVREGHAVAFSGFPIGGVLGFAPVTHRGIVSSITPIALPGANSRQLDAKLIRQIKAGSFDIFQLDATAYPGNSGSPLFDPQTGEVLGVISMVLIKGTKESALTQPSGITYAVPANFLLDMLRANP